ncbi:MAG: hypothetical protein ABIK37_00690 [candidate division WOR-3 bacterium]
MAKKRGRLRAWILLLLWVLLTVTALSVPVRRPPRVIQRGLDKAIHTGLFAVMGVLGQAATPWATLLLTAPIAFGVEYLQKKLPSGRTYEDVDLIANLFGLALGVICYELSIRLR